MADSQAASASPSPHRIQRKMSKSWISMSRKIPPEPLRYCAGGAPGSRLVTTSISGVPMSPRARRSFASLNVGSKRRWEPIMQGDAGGAHRVRAGLRAIDGQVDRLLAEDVLARPGGARDEVAVRIGGGGDRDDVDGRVGEHGLGRRHLSAQLRGELRGRAAHRVADELERDAGQRREVGGVDPADAAGTEEGDVLHGNSIGGRCGIGSGCGRAGAGHVELQPVGQRDEQDSAREPSCW